MIRFGSDVSGWPSHSACQQICVPLFRAEPFAQKIHQPRVHFDRQNFAGFFQKQFRQRSQSRPDFENFVRRLNFRRVHDAAQLVAVVQKILAERARQLNVAFRQQRTHFGESHGLIPATDEIRIEQQKCRAKNTKVAKVKALRLIPFFARHGLIVFHLWLKTF